MLHCRQVFKVLSWGAANRETLDDRHYNYRVDAIFSFAVEIDLFPKVHLCS